jgi:hypothetical protein
MHRSEWPSGAALFSIVLSAIVLFSLGASTARAQSLPPTGAVWTPEGYALDVPAAEPLALSSDQRLSIERGAADLGAATEQSLLSVVLYVSAAVTFVVGVSSFVVLFAEFDPLGHGRRWGVRESAALASAIGGVVAAAVTLPLAITVGSAARHRHERARDELMLTHIGVMAGGVTLVGQF